MEDPNIRKMVATDVARVHIIDVATDPSPWSEKLIRDCLNIGYDCWVLATREEVIGFVILNYGAQEAHILKLAVIQNEQGKGLGKKLLEYLIALAKIKGIAEIFLEVRKSNEKAIRLYKSLFFVEIGVRKGYYPANEVRGIASEDALTMALPLL